MEENKKNIKSRDKIDEGLANLKEKYKVLRKKYNLPEFTYLNENFEIEGLCIEETEILLKKIRKQIVEKIYYNTRALETFMNPQNAPLLIFEIIKSFDNADQELIKQLHKKLGEFEIEAFGLETNYGEQNEAEFIKNVCENWSGINADLGKIYDSMKRNFNKSKENKSKSYLG